VTADSELLESIDAKLGALLTLVLDGYLRQTGVARPKDRSVDKMLADMGLSAQTIAKLLGKTDRAVQLQLEKERAKKKTTTSAEKAAKNGDDQS
jgi:SOS response regulatory protein OraA/RecX